MLKESEVSKDSYHFPVKKNIFLKLQTERSTVDNLRLKVAAVSVYNMLP